MVKTKENNRDKIEINDHDLDIKVKTKEHNSNGIKTDDGDWDRVYIKEMKHRLDRH